MNNILIFSQSLALMLMRVLSTSCPSAVTSIRPYSIFDIIELDNHATTPVIYRLPTFEWSSESSETCDDAHPYFLCSGCTQNQVEYRIVDNALYFHSSSLSAPEFTLNLVAEWQN